MRKKPYYLEIYHHFIRQIYMGKLRVGDSLDPINILCDRFAASPNTVRTVLRMLSSDGFIETSRGKSTMIISSSGNFTRSLTILAGRKQDIADVYDMLCILLPSIAIYGAQKLTDMELEELEHVARDLRDAVENCVEFRRIRSTFMKAFISKAGNPIAQHIMDIAEDIIMTPRMLADSVDPFHSMMKETREKYSVRMETALQYIRGKQFHLAKEEIRLAYVENSRTSILAIEQLSEARGIREAEDSPKELPSFYLYDNIVSDVVERIFEGTYGEGDYLPSEGDTCETYQVSMPTVRSAYRTLNELGVAKTQKGKGTQIINFSYFKGIGSISLKEITGLVSYLEALAVASVVIEDIAADAAEKMERAEVVSLEQRLRGLWENRGSRRVYAILVLLTEITLATGCRSLIGFYEELKTNLIWCIFLERFATVDLDAQCEYVYFRCLEAILKLQSGKKKEFGYSMASLVRQVYQQTREGLQKFFPAIELDKK